MPRAPIKRATLIVVEGVDWRGLTAGIASGGLPALGALAARGIVAPLRSGPVERGRMAIGAISTGLPPEAHWMVRPDEAWPGGTRPIGRASWRVMPIWERLQAAGVESAVAAWPGTAPGRDWAATVVDPGVLRANGRDFDEWALPLDCAPADLRDAIRSARTHPGDVTAAMLAPLLPDIATIDQAREHRVVDLAVAMAAAATAQAVAVTLAGRDPAALFVHHRWLRLARTQFERAGPPFDHVAAGAWRLLDAMIGRLVELGGRDRSVIVASAGQPGQIGAIIVAGPEIHRPAPHSGMDVLDVAPTMLGLLGFTDPAMPGKPDPRTARGQLVELPRLPPPVPVVQDAALLAEVVAAGYRPPPPPPAWWRAYDRARLAELLIGRDVAAAARAADDALSIDPASPDALSARALVHVAAGEGEPLLPIAERLAAVAPDRPWGDLVLGAHHALAGRIASARAPLDRAAAAGSRDVIARVAAAWLVAGSPGDAERVYRALLERDPSDADASIGLSLALAGQRRLPEAEGAVHSVLADDPGNVAALSQLRALLLTSGRAREAARIDRSLARLGVTDA